ncbi:hypothetical protein HO173_001079 [Letharia columbiana]|uniref:PAC domain-containing protein n=1 Tax=Letharia columbiana TaxID=112416 RepID=A0A8H6L9E2_9LECA|nr:uncharacterized protein HO173_001079 [Letharia columbiana]KAF6240413.1 hypothetical protein HO173_001079 [Letharia columbiana]
MHPSQQAMRQVDGRQQISLESSINHGHHGQRNGAYQKIFPPIGAQDFQEFPTRRSNTGNPNTIARARFDASSPMPTNFPPSIYSQEPLSDQKGAHLPDRHRPTGHNTSRSASPVSRMSSDETYETQATSLELPALQAHSALDRSDPMEPLTGDPAGSFDLVAPAEEGRQAFSLEARSEQLFSRAHLEIIFANPSSLLRFTAFLSTHRPQSVPILIYYLDALKALKAIRYANAIAEALSPIPNYDFTSELANPTTNRELENKAASAFTVLTHEDLPAFITHVYVQVVSQSISRRITGTLAPHLREASEGLAEVFCLTDPSRPDNPIVFASEEFHRTTQYGMNYAIGRNCRFLQGPKTEPGSGRRLGDATRAGREHCEVFLNYRRDGSPFMNMLMIAPLCDSRGKIRYFIGAQVDVSGLVKDCTDLESLQQLVVREQAEHKDTNGENFDGQQEAKDDFQDLSEMLNMAELETVRKFGGRMHREYQEEEVDKPRNGAPHMPRLLLQEPSADDSQIFDLSSRQSGKLSGIYQNYLLVRPHPSFRILFASPTLRVPGILQSPFLDKIGGSTRVREELSAALAEGRGVTAKVRWVTKADEDGRNRWIHCTPLLGSNSLIGVWMVVLVDDDQELSRRWKQAPPVAPHRGRIYDGHERMGSSGESIAGRASGVSSLQNDHPRAHQSTNNGAHSSSVRSTSPNSVLI